MEDHPAAGARETGFVEYLMLSVLISWFLTFNTESAIAIHDAEHSAPKTHLLGSVSSDTTTPSVVSDMI